MKSFYKKTTNPVEISRKISFGITLIFLFTLFVPFNQSFAEDPSSTNRLVITAEPSTIKQGENTKITAKIYTAVGGEVVYFSTSEILGSFTGGTHNGPKNGDCVVPIVPKKPSGILNAPRVEFCTINFKTGSVGSIEIKVTATTTENGGGVYSSNLKLIVLRCDPPNTIINNICTPPEIIKPEPKINTDTTYTPLAPLPGLSTPGCVGTDGKPCINTLPDKTTNPCPFGNYLNIIIKLVLGIAGVLAMVMIVMGGIQYMTSDLVSSKEAGKETVTNAILGLLIGLGAWLILNTINPALLSACLDRLPQATVMISPDDTSTGSSTSLCLSNNAPNPDSAKGTSMKSVMSKPAMPEYEKAANTITSISKGKRYLITAQAGFEGFFPNSKSYKTNNPGNIGNTDDGKTKSFPTLVEGIQAQATKVVSGQGSYKINSKPTCALGNEAYDGSLYQYLRIYATGPRTSNHYLNAIIGYFGDNGKTITGRTKMTEIYNMQ